jgi:site-specific DNA-methyltransferase (adenine-specific)
LGLAQQGLQRFHADRKWGSGSECVAAKNLNKSFIGIEINPEYISLIHERLLLLPVVHPSEPQSEHP